MIKAIDSDQANFGPFVGMFGIYNFSGMMALDGVDIFLEFCKTLEYLEYTAWLGAFRPSGTLKNLTCGLSISIVKILVTSRGSCPDGTSCLMAKNKK